MAGKSWGARHPDHRFSLSSRFVHWTDRVLTTSLAMQAGWLVALCLVTICIGAPLIMLTVGFASWGEAAGWVWLRFLHVPYLGEDKVLKMASSAFLLAGWIVFSLLVSILSAALQTRLTLIRRNLNHVLATGHTIILGWDSTVFSVVDQLSSEDERSPSDVVILADIDKEEMEEELARHCVSRRARRVLCRTGRIDVTANVEGLGVPWAREVIILSGEDSQANMPDRHVLKAVLVCRHILLETGPAGRTSPIPLVATVGGAVSRSLLQPIADESRALIQTLLVEPKDMLSRIVAQSAAQADLALVYGDLLSYRHGNGQARTTRGGEIYIVPVPETGLPASLSFEDCLYGFPRAIPIGYQDSEGQVVVNPLPDDARAGYRLGPRDRLVCVADSREEIRWGGRILHFPVGFELTPQPVEPRSVLVIGEGEKALLTIRYLGDHLPKSSRILTSCAGLATAMGDCTVETVIIGGVSGILGEKSDIAADRADTIVLVDDERDLDIHDSRMLHYLAALHVRGLSTGRRPKIVVELVDPRNRRVAEATGANGVIISSEIISNYMVQLAREPARGAVYGDLLDAAGSDICLMPAPVYAESASTPLSFLDIMLRGRACGHITIGYIEPGSKGMVLAPLKRNEVRPARDFGNIVVIAEG